MASPKHLTRTHVRILTLLGDGNPHSLHEVHTQLEDDLSDVKAVSVHLSHIRRIIEPLGEDIISFSRRGTRFYMWLAAGDTVRT